MPGWEAESGGWPTRLVDRKLKYSAILFLMFVGMNLLVRLTYSYTGRISLSYLLAWLPFEGFFGDWTGYAGIGVLFYFVMSFCLIWAALVLIGTRMPFLGWISLAAIFASTVPLIDIKMIFI
jgi:hypothetical protein